MKTQVLILMIAFVALAGCAHKAAPADGTSAESAASADEDEGQGGGERVKP